MNKFLLFWSLISIFGYSQNNFKESSIGFKDGTIKKGFVNYIKTRNTPQEFKYKSSIESEIITLDSTEIESVEISNITKFIFRRNIEVSFESKNLGSTNNNKVKFINRFVEILVDGEYSLCNYSDNQYEKFYYFGNDLKLKPLKTRSYYNEEDRLFIVEEYKSELISNLGNNNPEIIKEIKRTRLNSSDLTNLFYVINKKDLAILKAKSNDGIFNIHLASDVNFITFEEFNVDFSNKTILNIGGDIEYVLPYYNNLFALELAPRFSAFKGEGIYYNPIPTGIVVALPSNEVTYYYDINNGKKGNMQSTTLSIPVNLKIYPINKKVKVYASLTLFNLLSFGKGKMNFENELSFEPDFVPPFQGFFEIGGYYKNFGLSFKKLKQFESSSQYFNGFAISLKYKIHTSKK